MLRATPRQEITTPGGSRPRRRNVRAKEEDDGRRRDRDPRHAPWIRTPGAISDEVDPQGELRCEPKAGACSIYSRRRRGRRGCRKRRRRCPASRTGDRYVAHILPLTSGARRKAGASHAASAMLFIREAGLDLRPEAVASRFKLTSAEIRVLFAIVQIGGAPEVARRSASQSKRSRAIYAASTRRPVEGAGPIS
jgi:hypothetical protein